MFETGLPASFPSMLPHRPNVALLVESSRGYGRGLLRGIAQYARHHTNWALLHEEMTIEAQPPLWLYNTSIQGVIARIDTHNLEQIRRFNAPIVDVLCRREFPGIPRVDSDDRRVAETAFEHLRDRGFRRFAYCGYQHTHYSDARKLRFAELVTNFGGDLSIYESPGQADAVITQAEKGGQTDLESLAAWLETLKRPTGLFVCNDIRGQQVLNVGRSLGIVIPDDIAVISVDNDDAICPLTDPPLSSVQPDVEQVGYRAAQTLHAMMVGRTTNTDIEYIPPLQVEQRGSTQAEAIDDPELARVCRFIRQFACEGINVGDVTEFASLSRRQLERRFRQVLGRSPHDEITAVQVQRVKQLLTETELTLEAMAPLAGYAHKESLSAVFKRETGETPGAYRTRMQQEI